MANSLPFIIRLLVSGLLALLAASFLIYIENHRLTSLASQEKENIIISTTKQIDDYFYSITSMLDNIEHNYSGVCSEEVVLSMRRKIFSILGGVEFGIVENIGDESYVTCNSWGDKEPIKVRKPVNYDGYLMTGPHKINSLGEPVYVLKKTKNDIEYNMILKVSSLDGVIGEKDINLIKEDKVIYGDDTYHEKINSSVISNVKFGYEPEKMITMSFYYKLLIFIVFLALFYFALSAKVLTIINKYILVNKIRTGNYFYNVFQPIYQINSNSIYSYEVFTRANGHDNAISIMQQIKKYELHDDHAINQIEDVMSLPTSADFQINISVKNMLSKRFFEYVSNLDKQYIKRIIFEITEDENLLDNKTCISQRMKSLKLLGYRFAIDDYGVGYSNLAYLVELNFDFIKIDKSITLNQNRNLLNIIKTLVSDLGAVCIAEGVESNEQKEMLTEIGIVLHQGWLYGKPQKEI
jgi:EAL domain-containing protein (putative c-di-GMP-specific phosphodiesterase class I)